MIGVGWDSNKWDHKDFCGIGVRGCGSGMFLSFSVPFGGFGFGFGGGWFDGILVLVVRFGVPVVGFGPGLQRGRAKDMPWDILF